MMKFKIIAFLLIALSFILLTRPLFAIKPSGLPTRPTKNSENTNQPSDKPDKKPTGTPGQAGKLASCQAREAAITTRSENLTAFSTRLINTFDKIATRVKNFYTTKGLSVSNYSVLIADIETKKTAAQSALTKAQAVITGFSCDTGNPKNTIKTFNEDMRLVHAALKDYKTSVRNLIVGIHSQAPSSRPTKGGDQ